MATQVRPPRNAVVPTEIKIPLIVKPDNEKALDEFIKMRSKELNFGTVLKHVENLESKMTKMGIPDKERVGATFDYHPALKPSEASFVEMYSKNGKFHIGERGLVDTFKLQRTEEGWHLRDVGKKAIDIETPAHQDLWLTPKQQKIVTENMDKNFPFKARDPLQEHAPRDAKEAQLPVKAIKQYEKALEDLHLNEDSRKGAQAVVYDSRNKNYAVLQRSSSSYHADDPVRSNWKMLKYITPGSVAEQMVKNKETGLIVTQAQKSSIIYEGLKRDRIFAQPDKTIEKSKGMAL